MNVSFIGSGNLAWHLAPALDNAGYVVKEVYSRNPKHAGALTERLYQAEIKKSLDFSASPSSLFIIATSDDAIEEIAQEIVLPDEAYLVHTSGSQALSALQFAAISQIGVLYPLQTFTRNKRIEFKDVPFFIESSSDETERVLFSVAKTLSSKVKKITSEERKALHIAAVFASNFTNHMLSISKRILEDNHLSFDLLKPLITETISKSLSIGPENTQTGPARRGDLEILDRHMEFLKDEQVIADIYKLISQDIIDQYEE